MSPTLYRKPQPHGPHPPPFPPIIAPLSPLNGVQTLVAPSNDFATLPKLPTNPADRNSTRQEVMTNPYNINDHARRLPALLLPLSEGDDPLIPTCGRCNLPFSGKLDDHIKDECPMKVISICTRCTATFACRDNLRAHQRMRPDPEGLTSCDKNIMMIKECSARGIEIPELRGKHPKILGPREWKTPGPPVVSKPNVRICPQCNLEVPEDETFPDHILKTCTNRPLLPTSPQTVQHDSDV
ncbi:hypothetical protein ONZ45_g10844 [Pleurotus djamor]|nr:hypothetical protein ONZ45_g10844 [Pleurotus djamor]